MKACCSGESKGRETGEARVQLLPALRRPSCMVWFILSKVLFGSGKMSFIVV